MGKISHNEVGRVGEKTACVFLMKRGFNILRQNYWKKWGEVDIVAKNRDTLHFIEVKTVSRENVRNVSRETLDEYRPEDNIHKKKLERLSRTIQTYLLEKNYSGDWRFGVITVFLDTKNKEAKCTYIENVII